MAITPTPPHSQHDCPTTPMEVARTRLVPLARRAAARARAVTAAAVTKATGTDPGTAPQNRSLPAMAAQVVEHVTDTWWSGIDWVLRRPFQWAVTRARLDVRAFAWDLDGRADRLLAWASCSD